MKKTVLTLIVVALFTDLGFGDPPPAPRTGVGLPLTEPQASPQTFNLDFPGGGPKALVAAIAEATGKPVNVIVPSESENVEIPAIKMTGVTVSGLFNALSMASRKTVRNGTDQSSFGYVFDTRGQSDNPVWYFSVNRPIEPANYCHFYQLSDFLQDYRIEDITTAIQTGWKLLGVKSPPQLKFHPETKLLIAVGHQEELVTIDMVLQELAKARPKAPKPESQASKQDGAPAKQ